MALITDNSWLYARQRDGVRFEYARLEGRPPPLLGMHFHDEDQFTLVMGGSRAFQFKAGVVHVQAGQCLCIPASVPHRSLPYAEARCFNLYVPAAGKRRRPVVVPFPNIGTGDIDPAAFVGNVELRWREVDVGELADDGVPLLEHRDDNASIGELASRLGMSREAFTRWFGRRVGMSPHAFRIVRRLNAARRQIRNGVSIASTAADCGFADQSHLGRHFRRVFGVTPRAYLEAMR